MSSGDAQGADENPCSYPAGGSEGSGACSDTISTRARASTATAPSGETISGLHSSSAISWCASISALMRSSVCSTAATSTRGAPR